MYEIIALEGMTPYNPQIGSMSNNNNHQRIQFEDHYLILSRSSV